MQEMNLAYRYGHMYWKNACLTVSAGAIGDGKNTDYGKIAKAVSEMSDIIDKPHINYSEEGFTIYNNKILFGLKAINKVDTQDITTILENRPFLSYEDLIERCGQTLGKNAFISFIKSGALDDFGDRLELMKKYIDYITEYKHSFTSANIKMLIEKNLIPKQCDEELKYYNAYKSICTKENLIPKNKELKGEWYKIDNEIFDELITNFSELKEDTDYIFYETNHILHKGKFKKIVDKKIETLSTILKDEETINRYNELIFKENWEKFASGNIPHWEMESVNYYTTAHELDIVDKERYSIENFSDLTEDPIVNEIVSFKGREFKRYKLSLIIGTVLDRDKTKHTVTLMTPNGVVICKLYEGAFNHYNKTISKTNNGKKTRIEESWFKRGNLLLIFGFRMGEQFKPRKYKNSIFQHSVMKIIDVNEDGTITIQNEREKT